MSVSRREAMLAAALVAAVATAFWFANQSSSRAELVDWYERASLELAAQRDAAQEAADSATMSALRANERARATEAAADSAIAEIRADLAAPVVDTLTVLVADSTERAEVGALIAGRDAMWEAIVAQKDSVILRYAERGDQWEAVAVALEAEVEAVSAMLALEVERRESAERALRARNRKGWLERGAVAVAVGVALVLRG